MALQPGRYGPKVDNQVAGTTIALPVISERISLPARACHLRMSEHLPPERARVARDLSVLVLDRADLPAIGVMACHEDGLYQPCMSSGCWFIELEHV